jgi:hypothetical protein
MPSQVATCLRLARQFSANPVQVSDLPIAHGPYRFLSRGD